MTVSREQEGFFRSPRRCRLAAAAFVAIAFSYFAIARGAAVRTIDDKSTSGTIKGFQSGNLLLQVKPADPAVLRIPLAEIAEVTFRALAVKPQAGNAGSKAVANPFRSWASIFGFMSAAGTEPADESPGYGNPAAPIATPVPVAASPYAANPVVAKTSATKTAATKTTAAKSAVKSAHRSAGPVWQVEFAAGDRVAASLDAWSGDRVRLGLDAIDGAALEVPVDRIRAIWSSSAALVTKAKDLNQTAAAQDIAFVEKDGDVKSVAGVAGGIENGSLVFKFEGEQRRIKLARVVGVLLSQREIAPEKSLFEAFNLVDGDVLSGRIESIEGDVLRMTPLFPGRDSPQHVNIPLDRLATIDVKNGRLTWIGDLPPSAVSQIPYFDRLMPYRVNQSLTGGQLVLAGGPVSKGIAVHSKCTLTYNIDGAFERFRVKVGFQQPEGKVGRAALRILGDGKVLWKEADLRGDASTPIAVDVSIAKVRSLTLEADYGVNFDVAGRIVWGEARLIKPSN